MLVDFVLSAVHAAWLYVGKNTGSIQSKFIDCRKYTLQQYRSLVEHCGWNNTWQSFTGDLFHRMCIYQWLSQGLVIGIMIK